MSDALPFPDAGADDAVFLVDISAYVFRAYHALPPLSSSRGEPTHAVRGTLSMLERLRADYAPAHMVIACDSPGDTFRDEIHSAYKANRAAPPEDLSSQMRRIFEITDAMGLARVVAPRFEADDLIASCCARFRAQAKRVVIVSSDKDLMQLVGPGVWMLDTMRDRVFDADAVEAKLGVRPERVRDYLALCGDAVDNVPGIVGVGPKTALGLLTDYQSLQGILSHAAEITRPALKRKVEDGADSARLSYELVGLRADVPLDFAALLKTPEADEVALQAIYEELEFRSALEKLGAPVAMPAEPSVKAVVLDADALRQWLMTHADALLSVTQDDGLAAYAPSEAQLVLGPMAALPAQFCAAGVVSLRDLCAKRRPPIPVKMDLTLALDVLGLRSPKDSWETLRQRLSLEEPATRFETELGLEGLALLADASERLPELLADAGVLTLLRELELPLASVLLRMESVGIFLDTAVLEALGTKYGAELAALEAEAHELVGRPFNLKSPKQLEGILFDELGLPVIKKTKTSRSTKSEVLEALAPLHALPGIVLAYRSLAKLMGTYIEALPTYVDAADARIHTTFHQSVTATGRLSSSDPNLQNIPIKTEAGRELRKAFRAREGCVFIAADYSQIELRVLASLSQEPALIEAFAAHGDIHRRTAAAIFGKDESEVSREERAQGKTVNFGVLYGQGEFALSQSLGITRKAAAQYIAAFFTRYAAVRSYFDGLLDAARQTGFVTTQGGRRRYVPDLSSRNAHLRQAAERVAQNMPIQGTAAEILKRAMIDLEATLRQAHPEAAMVLTVHDELVVECPAAEAAACAELVATRMRDAAQLSVPVEVTLGSGPTWFEAHG